MFEDLQINIIDDFNLKASHYHQPITVSVFLWNVKFSVHDLSHLSIIIPIMLYYFKKSLNPDYLTIQA